MFDILIPSWNNLNYLKLAIKAIKNNSAYNHNILVHVNENHDNTSEWLIENKIKHTISHNNLGVCKSIKSLNKLITSDWICICDDDIYVLPDWDKELVNFKEKYNLDNKSWTCSTMIEPTPGPITTISPISYGRNFNDFNELKLLNEYKNYLNIKEPFVCNQATPLLLSKDIWFSTDGCNELFDPAIGFEEGLAKRFWDYGCRDFVSVPNSLVYHFQCKSTRKITGGAENREKQFMKLYKKTTSDFLNNDLHTRSIWKKHKD